MMKRNLLFIALCAFPTITFAAAAAEEVPKVANPANEVIPVKTSPNGFITLDGAPISPNGKKIVLKKDDTLMFVPTSYMVERPEFDLTEFYQSGAQIKYKNYHGNDSRAYVIVEKTNSGYVIKANKLPVKPNGRSIVKDERGNILFISKTSYKIDPTDEDISATYDETTGRFINPADIIEEPIVPAQPIQPQVPANQVNGAVKRYKSEGNDQRFPDNDQRFPDNRELPNPKKIAQEANENDKPAKENDGFMTTLKKYQTGLVAGTGSALTLTLLVQAHNKHNKKALVENKKPISFGAFVAHVGKNPGKYPKIFAAAGITIAGTAFSYMR